MLCKLDLKTNEAPAAALSHRSGAPGTERSEAAHALHTSQPGVSKQIRALEDELGIQVFARHGKRLVSITEPGKAVVAIAERILSEAQNLRRAGEEFANDQLGTLTIAATHTQARYALPKASPPSSAATRR